MGAQLRQDQVKLLSREEPLPFSQGMRWSQDMWSERDGGLFCTMWHHVEGYKAGTGYCSEIVGWCKVKCCVVSGESVCQQVYCYPGISWRVASNYFVGINMYKYTYMYMYESLTFLAWRIHKGLLLTFIK